jgi:hypothetical protein
VPRALTIWDAAAPIESQTFMLVGAIVVLPVIVTYTAWAYWVFRGKVLMVVNDKAPSSLWKRLLRMVDIWATSVFAVGLRAYMLRLWFGP